MPTLDSRPKDFYCYNTSDDLPTSLNDFVNRFILTPRLILSILSSVGLNKIAILLTVSDYTDDKNTHTRYYHYPVMVEAIFH